MSDGLTVQQPGGFAQGDRVVFYGRMTENGRSRVVTRHGRIDSCYDPIIGYWVQDGQNRFRAWPGELRKHRGGK